MKRVIYKKSNRKRKLQNDSKKRANMSILVAVITLVYDASYFR